MPRGVRHFIVQCICINTLPCIYIYIYTCSVNQRRFLIKSAEVPFHHSPNFSCTNAHIHTQAHAHIALTYVCTNMYALTLVFFYYTRTRTKSSFSTA